MSKLRVMYVGDIMGAPGREVALQRVPALRKKYNVGLVIAQAENVSHGKSMTTGHLHQLQTGGIDFFTGGNHTIERPTMLALLDDPNVPVIAPINQPGVKPAWGAKTLHTPVGDVCIISLLGTTFPLADAPLDNPLLAIDRALAAIARQPFVAKIVNFHGDFSSEKRVIGFYLDGRVSAVIGDHWHVPTADAMVLPGGTAHITDVGMCGTLLSSLGVSKEIIIERWRDGAKNRNDIALGAPYQFNAAIITIDLKTGLATDIEAVNEVLEKLG